MSTTNSAGNAAAGGRNKRKSSGGSVADSNAGQSADDVRGGGGADPPLAPMASATQLARDGLGLRVGLAAVLLSEPFAAKLMYRHASAGATDACRVREMLPRDHPTFAPLLQLLELGDAARAMFQAGSFGVRAVEEALTRAVLPCVVALHTRAYNILVTLPRAAQEEKDGNGKDRQREIEQEEKEKEKQDADSCLDGGGQVKEDWRKWYREFPAVRRMTCTMFCRALVSRSGGDAASDGAALLMPAVRAAVKRMTDERWFWATLVGVLQRNKAGNASGTGAAIGGGGGGGGAQAATGGKLKPEVGCGVSFRFCCICACSLSFALDPVPYFVLLR